MPMSIDEQIEILQAIKAGKTVEWKPISTTFNRNWEFMHPGYDCDFHSNIYRIKQEVQTRTVWLNCYGSATIAHNSPEEARVRQSADILASKKITFTFVPGEFDE